LSPHSKNMFRFSPLTDELDAKRTARSLNGTQTACSSSVHVRAKDRGAEGWKDTKQTASKSSTVSAPSSKICSECDARCGLKIHAQSAPPAKSARNLPRQRASRSSL
jgi:hypothetical protein